MKNNYVVKRIYRSFVLVSILTALTATLGMLIDNIIAGRLLGETALGAMGVVGPVSLVFSAFSNICAGGGAARVSQALGRGERVSNVFTVTMLAALACGGLLTGVGLAFAPQIAALLGAQGALHAPATAYLRGFFLGAVPTILTSALMAFVKIDGSHKLPLLCIGVMTAANIALDLLLVMVFQMGMYGMALATSIAYTLAALTALTHFGKDYCSLRLEKPQAAAQELRGLVTAGAPTALSRICDTVKVTALNHLLVMAAGAGAVAALNVRTQAYNIVGALIMGVGQAVLPIAGLFYGEEDRTALADALRETLRVGLVLSVLAGGALFLFPGALVALLGIQPGEVFAMAKAAVRLYALGMPLQLFNLAMMNFYQSTRSTKLASLICVCQQLVFTTGFAWLLARPFGADGVWAAFLLGELGCAAMILAANVRHAGAFPRSVAGLMRLPEGFGGEHENRLELSIGNSMDEVTAVARGVYAFGQAHGMEAALCRRLSLCMEEMAGNVVRHAFTPGKKQWLDVIVVRREDGMLIRMRDNGALFDPVTHLRQHPEEEGYGLRMIVGLADEITYRRSIGLNNLTLVLRPGHGRGGKSDQAET